MAQVIEWLKEAWVDIREQLVKLLDKLRDRLAGGGDI